MDKRHTSHDSTSENGQNPSGNRGSRRGRRAPAGGERAIQKLLESEEARALKPLRLTKSQRLLIIEQSRGMWKDRPEWKGMNSRQIVAHLRAKSGRRGKNA